MDSEKIIKALECYVNFNCGECPLDCAKCEEFDCVKQALALINSQEQRIKELTEENERLKKRSVVLLGEDGSFQVINLPEERLGHPDPVGEPGECGLKRKCIADTVRKMQERLNKRFGRDKNRVHTDYNVHRYIDQIAKEMLEGETDNVGT